jgi:hypothetical protein
VFNRLLLLLLLLVQATGLTAMLESAYDKSGGCSAVNNIMDGERGALGGYM